MCKQIAKRTLDVVVAAFVLMLTACGGGGSSGGNSATTTTPTTQHTVSGTAAQGVAIANAAVTLVDKTGATSSATTSGDGSFSINTTNLSPPFMLSVTNGSTTLYSVSADTNSTTTINITPLTDLIIRSWYGAQGVSMTSAFAAPGTYPAPNATMVQIIANAESRIFALWFQKAGVNTRTFSPISTAFAANGAGVDAVLGEVSLNTTAGTITITDGEVTQISALSYGTSVVRSASVHYYASGQSRIVMGTTATGAPSVAVTNTTTATNGSSLSLAGTAMAVTPEQQTALAAIETTVQDYVNAINAGGNDLTAAELAPFLDANAMNNGFDAALYADDLATQLRGTNISSPEILQINNLDTTTGVADLLLNFGPYNGELFFIEESDGSWLISGDQQLAQFDLTMLNVNGIDPVGCAPGPCTNGTVVHVIAQSPQGQLTAAVITGDTPVANAAFNNTTMPLGDTLFGTFAPTSTTTVNANTDQFSAGSVVLTSPIPEGTPFTFTLTPAAGGTVSYTLPSLAYTSDAVTMTTTFTDYTLADFQFDTPVTLNWILPTTYTISGVTVSSFDTTSASPAVLTCIVNTDLPASATTGSVTTPSICGGEPVVRVNLNVLVYGIDGERSQSFVTFQ